MIIPVTCSVCSEEVLDTQYNSHMLQKHPKGQLTSILAQKNIPKTSNLPPGIRPEDLPSPEFMATMEEMRKAEMAPPPLKPVVAQPMIKSIPSTPEPVTLTYKYIGSCKCGNSVATLEMDVEGKHFCIAYCLIEKKQVEVREVASLTSSTNISSPLLSKVEEVTKTPSVVAKPSSLPPSFKAGTNDKPHKDLIEGVKETPIIAQKKRVK